MGLTINKKFISSVANIIGTDLSIINLLKNQFACSLMQVSETEKIPFTYLKIKSELCRLLTLFLKLLMKTLMPEYLMMGLNEMNLRQAKDIMPLVVLEEL